MSEHEMDDELQEMYEDPKRREKVLSNDVLRLPIKSVRLQDAISISPESSVLEAIELMKSHKMGCLLVVDSKKVVGIFTERDLLYKLAGTKNDLSAVKVKQYDTPNPEMLQANDEIGHALNLMHIGGYRHIPIVNAKGEPKAVLSIKDIVSFLCEYFPEDVLNVPSKPLRTTTEREGA
ncbi:MAG TPA: CBS domain-containing protein [Candidatus Kryptonia bacterium]